MNILKISLIVVLLAYLGLIILLYITQKHLVFATKKLSTEYHFNFKSNFKEGYFTSSNNKKINYLVFTQPEPKQIIIYYRGNAQALDQWGLVAEKLSKKTNSNVWVFDYPGFGKSRESLPASSKELIKLSEDFYTLAVKNNNRSLPIVAFGRSLGSGLASHVATFFDIKKLILETPYYSTLKVAKERYPFIPSSLFKYNLDNGVLKNYGHKVLALYGTNDSVIPENHPQNLAKDVANINLVEFEKGQHAGLESFPEYWPTIINYLK